jgi:hypothetical protein
MSNQETRSPAELQMTRLEALDLTEDEVKTVIIKVQEQREYARARAQLQERMATEQRIRDVRKAESHEEYARRLWNVLIDLGFARVHEAPVERLWQSVRGLVHEQDADWESQELW